MQAKMHFLAMGWAGLLYLTRLTTNAKKNHHKLLLLSPILLHLRLIDPVNRSLVVSHYSQGSLLRPGRRRCRRRRRRQAILLAKSCQHCCIRVEFFWRYPRGTRAMHANPPSSLQGSLPLWQMIFFRHRQPYLNAQVHTWPAWPWLLFWRI